MFNKVENTGKYLIHFDQIPIKGASAEIMSLLDTYGHYLKQNRKGLIARLKNFIEKYPHIPQFKNYLYNALMRNDLNEEAKEVLEDTLLKHPDYFFARADKAGLYLSEDNIEAAEALMGGEPPSDIQNMYPERKEFHITEVLQYYRYGVNYYIQLHKFDEAEKYLQNIKKFIPQRPELRQEVQDIEKSIFFSQTIFNLERIQKLNDKAPKVNSTRKQFFEPSEDAPVYKHPEIENLYYQDFNIPKELLDKIRSLPRATLIEDLEKMLADFQIRNDFLRAEIENEINDTMWCFYFHPIFLLAELRAYDSLPAVLNVFRQDEDFSNYWMGDYYQDFIPPFYQLAQNQLLALADYLKEENNETWNRRLISEIPAQVALHQPVRRDEVIDWYKAIFTYFLENKDNLNLIDGNLIAYMVLDTMNIEAIELLDYIKPLYDYEMANEWVAGNWASIEKNFREFNQAAIKYNLEADIHSLYQEILNPEEVKYMDEEKAELIRNKFLAENPVKDSDLDILTNLLGLGDLSPKNNDLLPNSQASLQLKNPPKTHQYNRNDRVNVKYYDGRIERDIKFKKIEDDYEQGLCEIID
jgi:hypothetical protein